MSRRRTSPGELERAIMRALWVGVPEGARAEDGLSVREVQAALKDRQLAYTTVMTVLDRLTKKDLVLRHRDGRAWRYVPRGSRGELTGRAMLRRLDGLDADERRSAILHFVDAASADELGDLRAALSALEEGARASTTPPPET